MEQNKELPKQIVEQMYNNDPFSKWLGIQIEEIAKGKAVLKMEIREDMLNGFGYVHGGVTYSLADSALAFAANSYNKVSLPIENSMSYPAPATKGDVLTAKAETVSMGNKTATFDVKVYNQKSEMVGLFRGTVYRTEKEHEREEHTEYIFNGINH